jgi:hypothetical protein
MLRILLVEDMFMEDGKISVEIFGCSVEVEMQEHTLTCGNMISTQMSGRGWQEAALQMIWELLLSNVFPEMDTQVRVMKIDVHGQMTAEDFGSSADSVVELER